MKKFFIFSLPRSGSAWLSVFLSGAGSYCYHDPLADGDFSSFARRLSTRPDECAGAIDTSAHQQGELPLEGFDKFVLLREMSQVQRSLKLRGWVLSNLETERDRLIKASAGAFPIYYERLHDIDYLERVWEKVVGSAFDYERAEYLVEMNIQREFAAVMKRVTSR